jgi:NAD(P)-dependent dehydrogenase (short-subunit alcohol dehydrogenase family)
MSTDKWDAGDLPDLGGRTFVVTGANSGIGASTARALARAGASVVLACRDIGKGADAAATMPREVEVRRLDLADLASVRSFADGVDRLDVLVNNAGVMALPKGTTADGFERQIGTNHLGHFALTGLLLAKITDRIVTLSSGAHRLGKINLDDLNFERRRYERWSAYAQSKLANLMFAYELQRRLSAASSPLRSLAAHPGYASTELQSHTESYQDRLMAVGNRLIGQSADMGALPSLYAAVVPTLHGGEFVGPGGRLGLHGHPKVVGSTRASKDTAVAARLWSLSERLTGVSYL